MFGLEPWVFVIILAIALLPVVKNAYKEYNRKEGVPISYDKADRKCLVCGFKGRMKTWLGNYFAPQFIALLGLIFFFIPGLIFIALASGKYKCPSCGALGKNQRLTAAEKIKKVELPSAIDHDTRPCPYCAETIKKEAIICRFCQRDLVKNS